MQLSNAMDAGRTLVVMEKSRISGCALGMANAATGSWGYLAAETQWPWILEMNHPCLRSLPCGCEDGDPPISIEFLIFHLFDNHVMRHKDWTLDRLIDWVRSVEPREETTTESSPVQIEQAVSA